MVFLYSSRRLEYQIGYLSSKSGGEQSGAGALLRNLSIVISVVSSVLGFVGIYFIGRVVLASFSLAIDFACVIIGIDKVKSYLPSWLPDLLTSRLTCTVK